MSASLSILFEASENTYYKSQTCLLCLLSSFLFQTFLAEERWVRPWACGSRAPWRASRQPCPRSGTTKSSPRCLSTARGCRWSEDGVATRASATPSTNHTRGRLKMVRASNAMFVFCLCKSAMCFLDYILPSAFPLVTFALMRNTLLKYLLKTSTKPGKDVSLVEHKWDTELTEIGCW